MSEDFQLGKIEFGPNEDPRKVIGNWIAKFGCPRCQKILMALAEYGAHHHKCHAFIDGQCTCGLEKAIEEFSKASGGRGK